MLNRREFVAGAAAALDKTGQAGNTLVVFTAAHDGAPRYLPRGRRAG